MSQQLFLGQSHLKFKVNVDLAMSVIYSLIMNIKNKDILPRNHMETFDFMVDQFICCLFRLFWVWLLVLRYFLHNFSEQSNLSI